MCKFGISMVNIRQIVWEPMKHHLCHMRKVAKHFHNKQKMFIYLTLLMLCMLLTTESRSARGASRHPAFMDGSLTVSQTRLPCPPCGKMRLQVLDCGDGNK